MNRKDNTIIPMLENIKQYKDFLHINDFMNLPSDTPFGNLELLWAEILTRLDLVNESIIKLYSDFEVISSSSTGFRLPTDMYRQKYLMETIIYWLRKTTDELISIVFIIDYYNREKEYPQKINIDSIAKILNYNDSNLVKYFIDYFDFLKDINDISNAYKHHLVNAQLHNHYGRLEPVLFVGFMQNNDITKKQVVKTIPVRNIIKSFNLFFVAIKKSLLFILQNNTE